MIVFMSLLTGSDFKKPEFSIPPAVGYTKVAFGGINLKKTRSIHSPQRA
jgi:hypothetical protein